MPPKGSKVAGAVAGVVPGSETPSAPPPGRFDTTAKDRIREFLRAHGPVEDWKRGGATAILREAVGYQGGQGAFVSVLNGMGDEVVRDTKGRRTYRISLNGHVPEPPPEPEAEVIDLRAPNGEVDYDELAAVLLQRTVRILMTDQGTPHAKRKIAHLEAQLSELERQVARTRAERDEALAERDEARAHLEAASHNLELLQERVAGPRGKPRLNARLSASDQALLDSLTTGNGRGRARSTAVR